MVCLVILFTCGLFLYLYCKVKQSSKKIKKLKDKIKRKETTASSFSENDANNDTHISNEEKLD